MGDIVNAVADVFGIGPASKQAGAIEEAARIAARSASEQTELNRRIYEENLRRQQPFLETGTEFFNQLAALQRGGPTAAENFLQMDPGYRFRLGEGVKALERSAAARGGLTSGATGKALTRYGQELGSQEYANAYNRLANLANVGPRTAGIMADLGAGYTGASNALAAMNAANQGNLALGLGNVRASQYGTMGSALNQALNTDWSRIGNYLGNPMTAFRYGTSPGSQQTSMLAAQEAGMFP